VAEITGAYDFNDHMKSSSATVSRCTRADGHQRRDARCSAHAEEAAVAQKIASGDNQFDEAMIAAMNLYRTPNVAWIGSWS
jgi:valyl-tRNA synthetase